MKDLIRIVLVDPNEESRNALQRLLGGIAGIWLSEVFNTYPEAAARASEIVAHLTIVILDHDTNQALELVQKLTQGNPNAVVLAASRSADSRLSPAPQVAESPAGPVPLPERIGHGRFQRAGSDSIFSSIRSLMAEARTRYSASVPNGRLQLVNVLA